MYGRMHPAARRADALNWRLHLVLSSWITRMAHALLILNNVNRKRWIERRRQFRAESHSPIILNNMNIWCKLVLVVASSWSDDGVK